MKLSKVVLYVAILGFVIYVGNFINYSVSKTADSPPFDGVGAFWGLVVIMALSVGGWMLGKYVKLKMESPTIIWICALALLITTTVFPGNQWITNVTKNINFMATTTPALALAGISLGKDILKFKSLGWKIVVVSLLVLTGTFILSAVFAQTVLTLNGTI